jgi:hypothetical protein
MCQGIPKYPPDQRQKETILPSEENTVGLEGYEEDWDRPGSILLGPQELMVQMKIVSHPVDFRVYTGTLDSAVTQLVSALSKKHKIINVVTGDQVSYPFSIAR